MIRTLAIAFVVMTAACSSTPDCTRTECVRAYRCRASCTTQVTSSGCCPCPAGTFDDLGVCLPDGGGGP